MATLLICDDEKNIRRTLRLVLEGEDHEVLEAERAEAALHQLEETGAEVVLLDVRLPGMDGLEALQQIKARWPATEVIMISGHASVSDAAQATRHGAYDFFEKPLERERVLVSVRNALAKVDLERRVADLAEGDEELLGSAPAIEEVKRIIAKVAPTTGRVLVTGESGTGKELVARALHRQSKRAAGPFVKVNCAAIPAELIESELFGHEKGAFSGAVARKRGRFELADGGTLFLDEIGDMPAGAQAKVLRALQNGEVNRVGSERTFTVDVRVVAATNKDLDAEARAGRFREDLRYRLEVVPIEMPPLRDRPEDIPLLAEAFLERLAREHGLARPEVDPEVLERLRRHRWPGNVRELRNVVERMLILSGDRIGPADLPTELSAAGAPPPGTVDVSAYRGLTLRDLREAVERDYIRATLDACDWNVTRAADALGVERTNLHKKMRHHGIEREG